ncbi:hypothetical protein [Nannocystis pusilla]|uniref:hypothetical protein n=1 Tax=Nannocystis pusilla TaxID=889268 RepID=UPI003DA3B5A1
MLRRPWPRELAARQLLRDDVAVASRLSVVGLVRLDEVLADRMARGMRREDAESWIDLHRAWIHERFGPEDLVPAFTRCPRLRAISELRIDCNWLGTAGVAEVLASPLLHHLDELELAVGLHTIEAFAPLARREMTHLRRFGLAMPDAQDGDIPVGDELADLLAAAGLERLESLALPRVGIGPAGLSRLFELPALAELDLARSAIGEAGCHALARTQGLSRLRGLDLAGCLGFDDDGDSASPGPGFSALITSPRLAVAHLGLGDVPGAAALVAASARMTTVEHLVLSEVEDDELASLVASPHLTALRHLRLRGCNLSSAALTGFGRSRLLAALESLTLSNDLSASQRGLVARRLPRLRELRLEVNHTTADSLDRADLPGLTELHLDFDAAALSQDEEVEGTDRDAVIAALVRAKGMPRLTEVVTSPVSPEHMARLAGRFGTGFRTRNHSLTASSPA